MKKILSVLVCLILSFSVFAFAGCDSAPQDLSALEKKIAALEDKLGTVEKDNAALEDMLGKVPDYKAEIDTLKATVTTLTQTIETLKTALDSLGTANTELSTALKKLETDLDKATARIEILEGINSGENAPVVYEVGVAGKDTFTFINNGIKLFSVTLVEYVIKVELHALYGKITNHALPSDIDMSLFFDAFSFKTIGNNNTSYSSDSRNSLKLRLETPTEFFIYFSSHPTPSNVTGFFLGIPNQTSSGKSLIPYAKFIL